jgi:hypothetical protein
VGANFDFKSFRNWSSSFDWFCVNFGDFLAILAKYEMKRNGD